MSYVLNYHYTQVQQEHQRNIPFNSAITKIKYAEMSNLNYTCIQHLNNIHKYTGTHPHTQWCTCIYDSTYYDSTCTCVKFMNFKLSKVLEVRILIHFIPIDCCHIEIVCQERNGIIVTPSQHLITVNKAASWPSTHY